MLFGRVKGSAVCTLKYPGTEGLKLLVVQPLNRRLEPVGVLQVAADVVDAGPGDLCVMVRSREAALAMPDVKFVPVDLALVGVVDELDVRPDGEFDFTLKRGWQQFVIGLDRVGEIRRSETQFGQEGSMILAKVVGTVVTTDQPPGLQEPAAAGRSAAGTGGREARRGFPRPRQHPGRHRRHGAGQPGGQRGAPGAQATRMPASSRSSSGSSNSVYLEY